MSDKNVIIEEVEEEMQKLRDEGYTDPKVIHCPWFTKDGGLK